MARLAETVQCWIVVQPAQTPHRGVSTEGEALAVVETGRRPVFRRDGTAPLGGR
ncbi:MAG: hypothetical protein JXC32_15295 [Anaerolineae bacterium]|nr:hypothetical protein [Anaerolineae bacterium]